MMNEKISPRHFQRKAIVYVRQSSQHQVLHNEESKRLQYAMEKRLLSLGWQKVEVIDEDLGRSASGLCDRSGFERMVAEVGLGKVGAVAAREVSRFARNSRDWHQLVEMCSLVDTLLIDHESVYDARRGNDRLLLGLKGSLSEYELDLLRQRSLEARWAKARRGELVLVAPVGYVKTPGGGLEKDPDQRVQSAIEMIFSKFLEIGSIRQLLMWLIETGLEVPTTRHGDCGWLVTWRRPAYRHLHRFLTDPAYAGAYTYGKTVTRVEVHDGRLQKRLSRRKRREWPVLIRDHHEGYITWEQFERIEKMLAQNVSKFSENKRGAARKGPALLAGLCRCRRCGLKLMVTYTGRHRAVPRYTCRRGHLDSGDPRCISFGGLAVDEAVVREVMRVVQPGAIDAAVLAAEEGIGKEDEVAAQLRLDLKAARFAVDRAWRQYDSVDPANRLVADELERRWNEALSRVAELEGHIDAHLAITAKSELPTRESLVDLAGNLESVWDDPETDVRLKKRILRTLIEEVVVDIDTDAHQVVAVIHWKGGVHTELRVSRNRRGYSSGHTNTDVVDTVRILARVCRDEVIASFLNRSGLQTGMGNRWSRERVTSLRAKRKIPVCSVGRNHEQEWMTLTDASAYLGMSPHMLRRAAERGAIRAEHPLANGPWVFGRRDLDEFEKDDAPAEGANANRDQLKLDISAT